MNVRLKPISSDNQKEVIDILNYYVENSYAAYAGDKLPYDYFEKLQGMCNGYPAVIAEDDNNILWVGSYYGLNALDKTSMTFTNYYHDASRNSLSHNEIRLLLIDKKGILWIGTNGGGLNKYENGMFKHYRYNENDDYSIGSDIVTTMIEDERRSAA